MEQNNGYTKHDFRLPQKRERREARRALFGMPVGAPDLPDDDEPCPGAMTAAGVRPGRKGHRP